MLYVENLTRKGLNLDHFVLHDLPDCNGLPKDIPRYIQHDTEQAATHWPSWSDSSIKSPH